MKLLQNAIGLCRNNYDCESFVCVQWMANYIEAYFIQLHNREKIPLLEDRSSSD